MPRYLITGSQPWYRQGVLTPPGSIVEVPRREASKTWTEVDEKGQAIAKPLLTDTAKVDRMFTGSTNDETAQLRRRLEQLEREAREASQLRHRVAQLEAELEQATAPATDSKLVIDSKPAVSVDPSPAISPAPSVDGASKPAPHADHAKKSKKNDSPI